MEYNEMFRLRQGSQTQFQKYSLKESESEICQLLTRIKLAEFVSVLFPKKKTASKVSIIQTE